MLCVERVCCKASVMPLIYIADFSDYMFGTVPKSNVVLPALDEHAKAKSFGYQFERDSKGKAVGLCA